MTEENRRRALDEIQKSEELLKLYQEADGLVKEFMLRMILLTKEQRKTVYDEMKKRKRGE